MENGLTPMLDLFILKWWNLTLKQIIQCVSMIVINFMKTDKAVSLFLIIETLLF